MNKKKILFLTNLLPYPLDGGGKIKTYKTLSILKDMVDIDLLCFVEKPEDGRLASHLEQKGIRVTSFPKQVRFHQHPVRLFFKVLWSVLSAKSYVILKYASRKMKRAVEDRLRETDYAMIFVDHLQLFQYIPQEILAERKMFICLEQHNVESEVVQNILNHTQDPLKRIFLEVELSKLRAYEKWACGQAHLVLAITDRDRKTLVKLTTGNAHCLESPFYQLPEDTHNPYLAKKREKVLLYLGTISWYPNEAGVLWFYENVYEPFDLAAKGWKWMIVGNSPTDRVQRMHDGKNIVVTGYVEDVRPYLDSAMIGIVPRWIQGGMLIKIFDFLSHGIPMVATTIGAEGIPVTNGENILLADSAEEFLAAIRRLETEEELRADISSAAIAFIQKNYSEEEAKLRYREIFKDAGF